MKLGTAHGWDKGTQREINEDSYLVWEVGHPAELNGALFPLAITTAPSETAQTPTGLFLIADGIGGAAAGEVASKLAIETMVQDVAQHIASVENGKSKLPDWASVLKRAVEQADEGVRKKRDTAGNDMGTTTVGALWVGTTAYVMNVGDSRAYRVTSQEIQRITHDHSYVQYLVDSGQIRDQDVRTHPERNIILKSLGDKYPVQVDILSTTLLPGECMLLCTDGLWEMIEDAEMQRIVNTTPDLAQAAQTLVQRANENGGADNITVILIKLLGI